MAPSTQVAVCVSGLQVPIRLTSVTITHTSWAGRVIRVLADPCICPLPLDSASTVPPGHNRGMRRTVALATVALIAVGALAGCKKTDDAASDLPRPSVAFCQAAGKYDNRVQMAKLPEQIQLVTAIAQHAPKDVSGDAHLFLDALQRRKDGDTSVVDDPKIETAINNVNRRAGQDCGWYKREGM